jgi:hypothetical protein
MVSFLPVLRICSPIGWPHIADQMGHVARQGGPHRRPDGPRRPSRWATSPTRWATSPTRWATSPVKVGQPVKVGHIADKMGHVADKVGHVARQGGPRGPSRWGQGRGTTCPSSSGQHAVPPFRVLKRAMGGRKHVCHRLARGCRTCRDRICLYHVAAAEPAR